jgi:hypothetical protein
LVFYQLDEESSNEENKSEEEDDERIGSGTTRFPSGLLASDNDRKMKITDTKQMFSQEDLSYDRDSKANNNVEDFMEEYNDDVDGQTLENAVRLKNTIHTNGAVPTPDNPPCTYLCLVYPNVVYIVYSINSSEHGRNSSISDEDVKVADLKSLLLDKNQMSAAYQSKGKSLDLS